MAAGQFAINVHESADHIENYVACGDLGGVLVDGVDDGVAALAIGLRELNDSGQSGVAILQGEGAETTVTVYLAAGLAAGGEASAAGTAHADHAVAAESASAIAVDIQDFVYSPDPLTVAAGDSVTWTNLDAVAHTATALDRDVLQTKSLDQGETFTATFETPGTYEYFCEFHPPMKGTLIVE